MSECISLATLLGYAAAALLGLLAIGLLAALIYLARRLRISIGLAADSNGKLGGEMKPTGALDIAAGAAAARRKSKVRQPARTGASKGELTLGLLLIGIAAAAAGLLIGIVI